MIPVAQATQLSASTEGYSTANTPFGEASWVTQYYFGYGRWGIYNLVTGLFYPESDWVPVT